MDRLLQREEPARLQTGPEESSPQRSEGGGWWWGFGGGVRERVSVDEAGRETERTDSLSQPTSVPHVGCGPEYTVSGGGPPYLRCPVVTSRVYWVLSRSSLILASSGPLVESETLVPCFSLCLYVFITPHRKALLFYNTGGELQGSSEKFCSLVHHWSTHLDVGQVTVLELGQHLQRPLLVELLQSFDGSFIQITVSQQT